MNLDALPKILFLHQQSDQMQDRRIRSKVQYDISAQNPKKVVTKKINNTIELTDTLKSNNEINRLAYSNKHGVMITSIDQSILLTDYTHLEGYLATPDTNKKSLQAISTQLKFSGKIYLSPDESKFLAVNNSQFLLFDISTLKTLTINKNQHQLRHFVFVNDDAFVGWNFHSSAYVYSNINYGIKEGVKLQGVQKCTSINILNQHIVACEKVNQREDDEDTKLIVLNNAGTVVKNEISLNQFGNPDNYVFSFTQIISIFTIKQQNPGQFDSNDIYGLVLGYYDDFEQEPDRRYLNFMKGDLLTPRAALQIRGFQLFLSPTQDRTFYYNQNQEKIPFEVQVLTSGCIKIIMIEKLEVVYVVDCTQPFSCLNLYTLQPSHEIKLQGSKYFQGMSLMRSMLQAQRKPPARDSNQICNMICKQFNGEFLSLYFSSKETQLTVPFPATIMVLGDGKIMRRYAIQTVDSVEEYEVDKVREAIGKIKCSKYVEKVKSPVKILPGGKVSEESQPSEGMKQQQQIKKPQGLIPQPATTAPTLTQKTLVETKPTEEKKSTCLFDQQPKPTGSLFSQPQASGSLFDQLKSASSLFDQKTEKKSSGPLFDNLTNKEQEKKSSLFAKIQQSTPNLFSSSALTQEQKPSLGLFDTKPDQGQKPFSLFNQNDQKKPAGGLFGSQDNKGSVFSLQKQKQPPAIEEKKQPIISPANILFQKASKQQQAKPSPFDAPQKKAQPKQVLKTAPSLLGAIQPQTTQPKLQIAKIQQPEQKAFITTPIPASISQPKLIIPQKKEISFPLTIQSNEGANLFSQLKTIDVSKQKPTEVPLKAQQKKQKQKQPQAKVIPKVQPQKKEQLVSQSKQKLQQIAQLMGFGSIQLIPGPLKLLTSQQGDALIQSLKDMAKPKVEEKVGKKLTQEEIAREKLLKKEHFSKIIEQIDDAKEYFKRVKEANNMITSSKMFTLKNVKELLEREKPVLSVQKSKELAGELRSRNQLVNVVRNYVRKMQMFAMAQRDSSSQCESTNQRGFRQREVGTVDRAAIIQKRISFFQDQVNQLIYYQDAVFPESISMWGSVNKGSMLSQDRWVNIGKKKIFSSQQLIKQAQSVLVKQQQIRKQRMKLPAPIIPNNNTTKSSSVITNVSQKQIKHKKGHFAFNLSSSDNSQNEQEQQMIQPKLNYKNKVNTSGVVNKKGKGQNEEEYYPYESVSKARVLIKLKPKAITLSPDVGTPLITLPSNFTSPLYVPQQFNPLDMFKSVSHPSQAPPAMQSSVKKAVNFNQRIPLKRQQSQPSDKNKAFMSTTSNVPIISGRSQQESKPKPVLQQKMKPSATVKSIKFDQSLQMSGNEEDQNGSSSDDDDFVPGIARTVSKFPAVQASSNLPKAQQAKKQASLGLQIKKTKQTQLPEKKDLLQETKQAAMIFGQGLSSQPSSKTNINLPADKTKTKPEQKPLVTGLFGAASGAASLFAASDTTKPSTSTTTTTAKTQSQKPAFGLFAETTAKTQANQPSSTEPKSGLLLFASNQPAKTQPSVEKKQTTKAQSNQPTQNKSLFGNQTSSLFSNLSLSSQPSKEKQSSIQSDVKAAQKAAQAKLQPKQQDKQNKPQPPTSLFGDTSKPSLFGSNNTATLFAQPAATTTVKKDQDDKQNQKQNKQPQKPAQSKSQVALFGAKTQVPTPTSSLFGQSSTGGLFNKKPTEPAKENESTAQDKKKQQQKGGIFGQTTGQSLFGGFSKPQQKPKPAQQQKQLPAQSLFQNKNVQPTTTLINTAPTTMFGGANRFLGAQQPQQLQQSQQIQPSSGFNPNATTFGDGNSSFKSSTLGGFKSFASFGEGKTSGMFGQGGTQQFTNANTFGEQKTMTGQQSSPFLQQSQPSFGVQQQSSLFNNQQQQQPQQQSSMFGQLQQQSPSPFGQSSGISNFLSSFNPSGMNAPTGAPSSNPSMLKPRK